MEANAAAVRAAERRMDVQLKSSKGWANGSTLAALAGGSTGGTFLAALDSGELGDAEGGVEAGDGGDGGSSGDGRHTQLLLLVGAMHTPLRVERRHVFESHCLSSRVTACRRGTGRSLFHSATFLRRDSLI